MLVVQRLEKKKIQPQNVLFPRKIVTKLANSPEVLQSFSREFANCKNLFLLNTLTSVTEMQLNRTEHLQNNSSLNLRNVEHTFSSSDAKTCIHSTGFIINITATLSNLILSEWHKTESSTAAVNRCRAHGAKRSRYKVSPFQGQDKEKNPQNFGDAI